MVETAVGVLKHVRENCQQELHGIHKECEQKADIIGPRIIGRKNSRKEGPSYWRRRAECYYFKTSFTPFLEHFLQELSSRSSKTRQVRSFYKVLSPVGSKIIQKQRFKPPTLNTSTKVNSKVN